MKKLYYLNSKTIKMSGLSLVSTMIFAFVLLVTVSSLVYIFRFNLLSIESLLDNDSTTKVQEQYINEIKSSKKISIGSKKIGDYKFDNELISQEDIFSNKMVDISLYHAKSTAVNEKILHSVYLKDKLISKSNLLFNKPPKHSMLNYGSKYVPINVPFVAIGRMGDSERLHRLKNGDILDKNSGYLGFIEKDYDWLLLSVNNHTKLINLSNLDIEKGSYKVKIGWNLVKGHWQMLMSIYDNKNIYIFKTSLEKIIDNIDNSLLDLSTPIAEINQINDIKDLTWYYPKNNGSPSLAIVSPSHDSEGNLSVKVYSVDYNQEKRQYVSNLKDTLNGIGKYDYNTVHIKALDPDFILAKSSLVISAGKKLIIYEALKGSADISKYYIKLEDVSIGEPIIIKKDKYHYYVITYGGDSYYQYTYTKDTDILSKVKPKVFEDEKIYNIKVVYGLKFIITKDNLYIDNSMNKQLSKFEI
ncbi:hypothetical protein [Francisella sp. Scap27]|uniref:hypothetical protein n=1 Tax=Francisella sp. Scap27 TaxID=2589986 RepID=UPI0015B91CCA|nr:hypothetical protein [Francisella sp. Scap27]